MTNDLFIDMSQGEQIETTSVAHLEPWVTKISLTVPNLNFVDKTQNRNVTGMSNILCVCVFWEHKRRMWHAF